MFTTPPKFDSRPDGPDRAASAYLLRTVSLDELALLEQRLIYDILGEPATAAVVFCDHLPGLTVGREGSAGHIRLPKSFAAANRWPIEWVARGGGVQVHTPGQVACYPVLALDSIGLTVAAYVELLCDTLMELARFFDLPAERCPDGPGVLVRGRAFAMLGVAVRHGVTTGGLVVNVSPDLEVFHAVDCDRRPRPMTSLQRECASPVRMGTVRQQLLTILSHRLGFARVSVFHAHPNFPLRTPHHAIQPARR